MSEVDFGHIHIMHKPANSNRCVAAQSVDDCITMRFNMETGLITALLRRDSFQDSLSPSPNDSFNTLTALGSTTRIRLALLFKPLLIHLGKRDLGQQIRPTLRSPLQRLLMPPLSNVPVMPTQQHLGHRHAMELLGSGVVRTVQQSTLERVFSR
jgi:hypothetical protein